MTIPHRKRLVRREVPGSARFLTFSCQGRLPLLSNPSIARLLALRLGQARQQFNFRLVGWVIMPEHVHLLVSTPPATTVDRVLEFIKKSVAQRVISRWKLLGAPILERLREHGGGRPRFWQKGGGFDRNVRDLDELTRELRYIHHNPVERWLCPSPTDWECSSARWWAGFTGEGGSPPLIGGDPPPGGGWESWKGWR